MKKVLFSLFVLAGFAACTSDDVVISDSTGATSLDGATTYLTVSINDVNTSTRATSTGFQNAIASEYAVNDAYFYFYDEDGLFVSRAEVWDGYTEDEGTDGTNIQWKSNTVVVLKGLTDTKFPRYMITILNEPNSFENGYGGLYYEPAGTLAEMEQKLAFGGYQYVEEGYSFNENAGIIAPKDGTDYFVMSTTSYITDDTTDRAGQTDGHYFVTEVFPEDFSEEPIPDANAASPIEVYVERLAAKVELLEGDAAVEFPVSEEVSETGTLNGYKLTETIAGEENWEERVEWPTTEGTSSENAGVDDIYIVIEGWKLNSTARNSYIMKNLDESWAGTESTLTEWTGNEVWNDPTDHRSYWGKAYLYGQRGDSSFDDENPDAHFGYAVTSKNLSGNVTYPTVGEEGVQQGNYDYDELDPATWLNSYVKYTSLIDANEIGSYEYCAENTNSADATNGILNDANSSAITSALIKARAYSYDDANDYYVAQSLISFEGMLFTDGAFSEYIYQRVIADVDKDLALDYSVSQIYEADMSDDAWGSLVGPTGVDPGSFTDNMTAAQLDALCGTGFTESLTAMFDASNITWVNAGNGNVNIEAIIEGDDTTASNWIFIRNTADDGSYTYTFMENFNNQSEILASITDIVDGYNGDEGYEISVYADGLMYYSVPIEHLNNSIERDGYQRQTNAIEEAQYGVVRNHWYELTVNGVTKMGKAIVDENEVIVPDPTDPTYFYVEANINVLAWKNVTQGIIL